MSKVNIDIEPFIHLIYLTQTIKHKKTSSQIHQNWGFRSIGVCI